MPKQKIIDLNGLADAAAALRQRRCRERRAERLERAAKQQKILRRLAAALDRQDRARVRGSRAKERESAQMWVNMYRAALGFPAGGAAAEDEISA